MLGLIASAQYSCSRAGSCVGRTGVTTQVFIGLQTSMNYYLEKLNMQPIPTTGVINAVDALALNTIVEHFPQLGLTNSMPRAGYTAPYIAAHADELFHVVGMYAPKAVTAFPTATVKPTSSAPSTTTNQPRTGSGTLTTKGDAAPLTTTNQPRTTPVPMAPAPPSSGSASSDPSLDPAPDAGTMMPGPTVVVNNAPSSPSVNVIAPPPLPTIDVAPVTPYDDAAATRKLTIGLIVAAAIGAVATGAGYLVVRRKRRLLSPA